MANKKIVKYSMWVKVYEVEDYYTTVNKEERDFAVDLPLASAGALDLNAVAAAMVAECTAEIDKEEAEHPADAD